MVTTSTFYRLDYANQAELLLTEGSFLLSGIEENFIVDLYELDELLIEVFYQKEDEELVSLMAYNTSEKLKSLTKGNLQPRLSIRNNTTYHSVLKNHAA